MADNKGDKVTTPKFRMSFPALLVASAMKNEKGEPDGEAKFSVVMLFDKAAQATPEFAKMKDIAKAAAIAKFGPDYKTKVPNLRSPFRDGAEKALEGYGEGVVFVSASTKTRPGVVDGNKNRIDSAEEIFPGRYARATVTAYAYEKKGNKGVAFGLHNVQLLKGGESLSGRVKAEDDFDEVEEAFTEDDDF